MSRWSKRGSRAFAAAGSARASAAARSGDGDRSLRDDGQRDAGELVHAPGPERLEVERRHLEPGGLHRSSDVGATLERRGELRLPDLDAPEVAVVAHAQVVEAEG